LAIAASSLVSLDNRRGHDKKLREAVFHISQGLSDRGVFPVAPPEHHQGDRMATVPLNEAILAYVELIRRTPMTSIDEGLFDLVKKMLLFFDDTRVRHPGSEKEITDLNIGKEIKHEGWRKFDVAKSQFDPISTIDAVNALAAINQMLDEKINQVILEHFSVKRLEKNLTALDMDDLFYPDYGLVASGSLQKTLKEIPEGFKKSDWPEDFGRKESVAVTLQKIRAHVQHVSLETEALCSVALHGPPGTGKTTLVEALAKTCGVPLVEVTPSDIIIGARRPSNDKHERCLRR
jgi:ABC-type multidrug transport system fused ATPase/permease subunit